MNRVAITTAIAAHKTMELSLIPEEITNRKRKENLINLNELNDKFKLHKMQTKNNLSVNTESNLRYKINNILILKKKF